MKKIIGTSLTLLAGAMLLASCTNGTSTTKYATDISLNQSSVTLKVGDSTKLTATVTPSDYTYGTLIWSSEDENIVFVTNGLVTAKSAGNAKIFCSINIKDGEVLKTSCAFTVTL